MFFAAKNRMYVSYTCAATAAIVWIISHREKTHTLLQVTRFYDLFVEVMDDWNTKSSGAGVDPVFAELVSMP